MGHVDHGKTSFLDAVRGARVADKEAGGITQNTRVHEVETKSGFKITFIDTPGHEAFSNMRARGAKVTDFVLLMVAADDGIQPQTKESIKFAKDNGVPIIVAINKIDLPGVDLNKIKAELGSFDVQIEEYGGDVLTFEISAKQKKGLDELLEGIELMSEINELKPNSVREGAIAEAFVLESMLGKHIGYNAMCVLKSGDLDDRYFGVTKQTHFKVRAYMNEDKKGLKQVHESQPFVVSGLNQDLKTGDSIFFVKTEDEAKEFLESLKEEVEVTEASGETDAGELFAKMLQKREEKKSGKDQKQLPIILKTSTQGTLEAATEQLESLENEESRVKVISSGTGAVTEDDLNMASVSGGIVMAFQTEVPKKIIDIARRDKIILRQYEIIYNMIDEVSDVLDGIGSNFEEKVELGEATIKQIFELSNGKHVAGAVVNDGVFKRGYKVFVERDGEEIAEATLTSLRMGKEEVKEVKKGKDCGMIFSPDLDNLEEGDSIVAFKITTV